MEGRMAGGRGHAEEWDNREWRGGGHRSLQIPQNKQKRITNFAENRREKASTLRDKQSTSRIAGQLSTPTLTCSRSATIRLISFSPHGQKGRLVGSNLRPIIAECKES